MGATTFWLLEQEKKAREAAAKKEQENVTGQGGSDKSIPLDLSDDEIKGKYSADQLKAELDRKEIEYKSNDNKDALIAKLRGDSNE